MYIHYHCHCPGSQTLSPARVPWWVSETISAGARCSVRLRLQRNFARTSIYHFAFIQNDAWFAFFSKHQRQWRGSWVTSQQGFQWSLAFSEALKASLWRRLSCYSHRVTGHASYCFACFTPGANSSYLSRILEDFVSITVHMVLSHLLSLKATSWRWKQRI